MNSTVAKCTTVGVAYASVASRLRAVVSRSAMTTNISPTRTPAAAPTMT
jgi:hypothetical protein